MSLRIESVRERFFRTRKRPVDRELRQRVWQLSAPAVAEMVMISLVSVINMMMVSRLGPEAVAAVGIPQQPILLALSLVVSLNVGTTALVARAVGAQEGELARRAFSQSWVLSGILGLLLTAGFIGLAAPIVHFMGAREQVAALAVGYLRIVAVSMPLFTLSSTVVAALRGAGETRAAMIINATANVVVVLLGLPLIYGLGPFPALGVPGAAWSLVGARVYMLVAASCYILGPDKTVRLVLKDRRLFDRNLLRQTLHIGVPSALEQFLLQSGLIVFVRTVAGMGTVVFAAHQIISNITSLSWQPGQGFGVAATALAGQYLGAGRPDQAEAAVEQARRFGQAFAWVMLFVFLLCGRYIISFYTSDPEVIRAALPALWVVALVQPSQSSQIIRSGGLRGAGATIEPLVSTAVGIWVVRNAVAALTVGYLQLGLVGAWTAIAVDQYSRYLFATYLFRRGRWKYLKVGI